MHITDDGIAIIRIASFGDDSMIEKVYACFDELKNAKGYILDVRGNSGGNSANAAFGRKNGDLTAVILHPSSSSKKALPGAARQNKPKRAQEHCTA